MPYQVNEVYLFQYIVYSVLFQPHATISFVCRAAAPKSGLEAEMAQRRRLFEHKASLQKDGIEKCIREKQHGRHELEREQEMLRLNYNQQIMHLEERCALVSCS